MNDDDETEGASHPLFPAKDEHDDPPEVKWILVSRNGEHFPGAFKDEELTDLAQIADQWGGGTYELVARNDRHITAKRQFRIPGPPKPLTFSGAEEAPASVAPMPAPAPAAAPESGLLPYLMQSQQMMMQMMMAQSQQQSQMMIALLTSGREQMAQHLQQMQQQHDRSQAQQMQMMTVMLESQKGSRPDELILRGIELANEIKGGDGGDGGGEGEDLAEIANAAAQVFQGVSAFQGMQPPAGNPGGEAPPNGAAHQ